MVRSMYSGVAGMKANQGRMDVIGNNIANANTYGFKSSRATFRDMYYQQIRGASGGTANRGGINPSTVGYGAQLSSIDLMMTQSALTSTGNPLDVAITGEGFIQVMDPDGNVYYTKAGMLDIDPATGAVIDSNGNFVLGTSATNGKLDSEAPGNNKIIIQVDPVRAHVAEIEKEIGGKTLTITSTNQSKAANVSFTFTGSTELPDGQSTKAIIDQTSGSINIQFNAKHKFKSMQEVEKAVNDAITQANGGPHKGGNFNFKMQPDPFTNAQGQPVELTGAELVETASAEYEGGGIKVDNTKMPAGFGVAETGLKFSAAGQATFIVTDQPAQPGPQGKKVQMTIGGITYEGFIPKERSDESTGANKVILKNTAADADPTDTITLTYPHTNDIKDGTTADVGTATASQPTKKLGLGKGTFTLVNGTEYTEQDISNLTGISIGADGVIMGTSAAGLQTLGRIDLATFANSKGLMQAGNTYFTETANSGKPKYAVAGEDGTGKMKNSALEMSNVDLSQEFSDMITTQRGFQASSRLITVSDTMLEELINLKR